MTKSRLLKRAVGVGMTLALTSLPLLSGCTAMASQEQIQMLEEARKTAESAEAELNACKQKRADLERQLAQKKQQLAKVERTRDAVRAGMAD